MSVVTVLVTVVALLVGGQSLFLGALRMGFAVAFGVAALGFVARSVGGDLHHPAPPWHGSPGGLTATMNVT